MTLQQSVARKQTPMREKAAHSQSEAAVVKCSTAFGGLMPIASFPAIGQRVAGCLKCRGVREAMGNVGVR